ncbi:MAG: phage scaffolding protein [Butyricicoccus pullicaecorum]|nr:phage scaffolding protein [Butyricicoccus pullicaecorum]
MDKEALLAMGITDEQAIKILSEINNVYVPKTQFNEVNTELQTAKKTIKERDTQLDNLQKSTGDITALKQQITDLQTENKNQKIEHDKQMQTFKIENAVNKALTEAKAINPDTVKPLLSAFLEKAVLSEDGTVFGLSDEVGKLVKGENTSFLFKADENPVISGASPAGVVTTTPDVKQTSYETRLAEARKTGNSALAVAIKREAAADGIQLF